jgi:hypothetical protein
VVDPGSGRSSGFPAFSAAFPFRFIETVAHACQKSSHRYKASGWVTAAGPSPIRTEFPIMRLCAPEPMEEVRSNPWRKFKERPVFKPPGKANYTSNHMGGNLFV